MFVATGGPDLLASDTNDSHPDIDYISVKRFLMVWFDLVIVAKSGAAIRLRPLAKSDAEHAEDLIKRQLEKQQS